MRIGLDFDNTIVCYDALFHKVALETNAVPAETPRSKLAVRNYLRSKDKENVWTELQAHVYGARMDEAFSYPGVTEFLSWATESGHELAIISHKTKYPFLGPRYDLHDAALVWIEKNLRGSDGLLVPIPQVFFELTREEKLARIRDFDCEVFLDDLPEILRAKDFPSNTRRILFDPEEKHVNTLQSDITVVQSWDELVNFLRQ